MDEAAEQAEKQRRERETAENLKLAEKERCDFFCISPTRAVHASIFPHILICMGFYGGLPALFLFWFLQGAREEQSQGEREEGAGGKGEGKSQTRAEKAQARASSTRILL
eukprot:COSAG05_NODE_537_length_8855_cov_23.915829_10_plen_110_part_00